MTGSPYRLIDTAGSELEIVEDPRPSIEIGDEVQLADGTSGTVVDLYDVEHGQDGGVVATLVVEAPE
jgi:hypothetical protein